MKRIKMFLAPMIIVETLLFFLLLLFYVKDDIKVLGVCCLFSVAFNALVLCILYLQSIINESDYCDKHLSYDEFTEVIPLTSNNDVFISHLKKIAKFKAILDTVGDNEGVVVKIFIQLMYEDTDILYEVVKNTKFRDKYKIK